MSKKAISKLTKTHSNYTMQVELSGNNKAGKFLAKAFIQVFDPKYEPGKQPTILKSISCWGLGDDEHLAQDNAIEVAVAKLGL